MLYVPALSIFYHIAHTMNAHLHDSFYLLVDEHIGGRIVLNGTQCENM